MKVTFQIPFARRLVCLLFILILSVGSLINPFVVGANFDENPVIVGDEHFISGASGKGDERDVDIFPIVGFDSTNQRYLVVWSTLRNAGSSSSGFDIYGQFLNKNGYPTSSEFRISDTNSAARNGTATISVVNGTFIVAWAKKGSTCQIVAQRVFDTSAREDQVLLSGVSHIHSPSLTYNSIRGRFLLAYVEGDDYLPPTFSGAETANCGNNVASQSQIKVIEFHLAGTTFFQDAIVTASDVSQGAFRPKLSYNRALNQTLVTWEDRRNNNNQPYNFMVYAQRYNPNLSRLGNNIQINGSYNYSNFDTATTWTPRPVVANGRDQFLIGWYNRVNIGDAVQWTVQLRSLSSLGLGTPFTAAQFTFANSRNGETPTGFLAIEYSWAAKEYLVGFTSHLDSVFGDFSSVRVQRVLTDGRLIRLNGTALTLPTVGQSLDYENDTQISIGMAIQQLTNTDHAKFIITYAKHSLDSTAQDLNIWGIPISVTAKDISKVFLPIMRQK